jgi:hypothetical protein
MVFCSSKSKIQYPTTEFYAGNGEILSMYITIPTWGKIAVNLDKTKINLPGMEVIEKKRVSRY